MPASIRWRGGCQPWFVRQQASCGTGDAASNVRRWPFQLRGAGNATRICWWVCQREKVCQRENGSSRNGNKSPPCIVLTDEEQKTIARKVGSTSPSSTSTVTSGVCKEHSSWTAAQQRLQASVDLLSQIYLLFHFSCFWHRPAVRNARSRIWKLDPRRLFLL